MDIETDSDGNVYIADPKNNRVIVLDRYYNLKFSIAGFTNSSGISTDALAAPSGVFVWEGLSTDINGDYVIERLIYVADTNNERIYALCFDLQDRLIACRIVSDGDIDSSVLDARKLAAIVLEVKAKKVILSHNHPNGTVTPSVGDANVTKYAFDLLRLLKVQLTDHIIVTDNSYFSMAKSPAHIHLFYGADPLLTGREE